MEEKTLEEQIQEMKSVLWKAWYILGQHGWAMHSALVKEREGKRWMVDPPSVTEMEDLIESLRKLHR